MRNILYLFLIIFSCGIISAQEIDELNNDKQIELMTIGFDFIGGYYVGYNGKIYKSGVEISPELVNILSGNVKSKALIVQSNNYQVASNVIMFSGLGIEVVSLSVFLIDFIGSGGEKINSTTLGVSMTGMGLSFVSVIVSAVLKRAGVVDYFESINTFNKQKLSSLKL